jgi:hypothetical protein
MAAAAPEGVALELTDAPPPPLLAQRKPYTYVLLLRNEVAKAPRQQAGNGANDAGPGGCATLTPRQPPH